MPAASMYFCPHNNVGKSAFRMWDVKRAFGEALAALEAPWTLSESMARRSSLLSRIFQPSM